MSKPKPQQFQNETNTRLVKVYVGPTLGRAVDRLAEADRRPVSEWIRLLLEREASEPS